ncbi:cyclase family protein [candidate division KSB1 bacterium]|nr:cyclase family protein [candidate division KSB1 bacterium]
MNLKKKKIIDLTHLISEGIPVWPGDPRLKIETVSDFKNDSFYMNNISMSEHTGTHIGAPMHFYPFGADVSELSVNDMIIIANKINIKNHTVKNADYLLTVKDILKWEETHDPLPAECLVLIETGWSKYWDNPNIYFGFKHEAMHFPGISLEAIMFLVEERKIKGIGIDSASIDGGKSMDFIINRYCSESNIYHLENLTNLNQVNESGFLVFIGVLPIKRGSGSPCRVVALQ